MNFKILKIIFLYLLLPQQIFAQTETGVVLENFSNLAGTWKGTSKYLDFESNKYIIDSVEMIIYRIKNSDSLTFLSFKPNETTTASVELTVASKGGKLINDKNVKYKYNPKSDSLEVIKEYNKYLEHYGFVLVKNTFIIGKRSYINRREIQMSQKSNWMTLYEKRCTK